MNDFHHDIMAKAIERLIDATSPAPTLEALATMCGYEATQFQKLFKAYVGISPKRFQQFLTYRRARDFLLDGYTTLDAAHAAGLSGGGRLHNLFINCEAATPGSIHHRGAGLMIRYGFHSTPIGEMLLAENDIGICWAGFVMGGDHVGALDSLINHWPKASIVERKTETAATAAKIFEMWRGGGHGERIKLHLQGTNFQIQVWQALMKIPSGATASYQAVASSLGMPRASRAVGGAIGANKIALLIPCHRVIQQSGVVENYAWGSNRKKLLLGLESEHVAHRVEAGRLAI